MTESDQFYFGPLPSAGMLAGQSDEVLRQSLQEANIPTLLAVLVHISGDVSLLQGDEMPTANDTDGVRNMSNFTQQALRDRAFAVLRDVRDGSLPLPPLPDTENLQVIASACAGEQVGLEYLPMMLEDMGFTDSALRRVEWRGPSPQSLDDFRVLIVGAGVSGICAAIHLERAGIPYQILEKNDDLGGTWLQNTYPGCGVDTPNHFYSYSFAPNNNWSAFYSKREEIFAYLSSVAKQYGVREHIRFNADVQGARYDEDARQWRVAFIGQDGREQVLSSNILICGVGQVNRPTVPAFEGRDSFSGPAFHSAEWEHQHDLTGKRVAVIGTGASAMQFCPAIAEQVEHLTIFQRTPHWIRMMPDYHRKVGEGTQWLLKHVPYYRNWYRFRLYWGYGDEILKHLRIDPKWPHRERSVNAENEKHRQIYARRLEKALNGNRELMAKVIPDYPLFGKRMLIDNHWCEMLQRRNVELLARGVSRIAPQGVVDDKGLEHKADVLVYATGFNTLKFLWPMEIFGRGGKSLQETWGEDARAYLGMTVPDFPNLFVLYGPNTNLAHGGSVIFHAQCQSRYIVQCLMRLLEAQQAEIEVRRDVHDEYNRRVDEAHSQLVWTNSGIDNWSKNSKGRVVCVTPWRLVDYWRMTYEPDLQDYLLND